MFSWKYMALFGTKFVRREYKHAPRSMRLQLCRKMPVYSLVSGGT